MSSSALLIRLRTAALHTKLHSSEALPPHIGLKGLDSLMACSSQARQEGMAMLSMVDQGVHTHACHHALTWPSDLHGLELKVVTWQFRVWVKVCLVLVIMHGHWCGVEGPTMLASPHMVI